MTWSDGQGQALDQLEDIAERASEDFAILEAVDPREDGASAKIEVSISTKHLDRTDGGLPLRARERLAIYVPSAFPLDVPRVYATHKRFAGFPHVQWANFLCLYQAPEIEWVPSDGMYGFVQRLNEWLRAAALNQLDPEDAPLHPPVVYTSSDVQVVARANAPGIPDGAAFWIGSAHLTKVTDKRLDLGDWSKLGETPEHIPEVVDLAPAILLGSPLPMEYPETVYDLIMTLRAQGISIRLLFDLLELYALRRGAQDALFVVLGAPMRRKEAGGELKQHLAVWRIEPGAATDLAVSVFGGDVGDRAEQEFIKWAASAKTEWCRVHEDRAEITVKRDEETLSSWLRGKRVLLLGCGALGSFTAEYLARAGIAKLDLVDHSLVKPGILVRQLFVEQDIGQAKSTSLKNRIVSISPNINCTAHTNNLKRGVLPNSAIEHFDLVIDTTASQSVSHVVETELTSGYGAPPIVSMSVSARADYAMATVRMSGYPAGPIDIARRAKLSVFRDDTAEHFAKVFWPRREDVQLFQPEPGCSEPTFVGSAIDMAAQSSAMLNIVLERIIHLGANEASVDFISKPTSLSGSQQCWHVGYVYSGTERLTEAKSNYRVLIAPGAARSIETYIRKGARELGANVETGGLMFGEVDDSLQTIWLDAASGPPPDSEASEAQFLCGVADTKELAQATKASSGGSSRFIGIWHTHPISMPAPSSEDLYAMANLLHTQERAPRQTVMLIVGHAATQPQKAFYLYRRKEFIPIVVRFVNPHNGSASDAH